MKVPLKWLQQYIDLPKDLKTFTDKMSMIGHMLDKTIETANDTVLDLELRGNRADCYGILGIAREAHASFGGRFDIPKPELDLAKIAKPNDFTLEVTSPAVHRFDYVIIRNVSIKPSPEWLRTYLINYGMEPINNIVDITNFVMIESGMPLHAFDLNKIRGNKMLLRQANPSETFISFDGGTLTLTDEDVVFANAAGDALGLVGIVGEKGSGIQESTTDILLECAGYDQATIRKTVYRHNVITEAGIRHTHDLDGSLCDYALPRAAALVIEHAGGEIAAHENYEPAKRIAPKIDFDPNEVTRLGGVTVPAAEQITILKRLECTVEEKENSFIVTPPLFRTDLKASEDIVEEVLRIWGYEKIPIRTLASVVPLPVEQREVIIEEGSRDLLRALGLDEIITVPFFHGDMFDKLADPNKDRAVALVNPPTSLHTHMRTTMFVEHLQVAHKILARGDEKAVFYEVGKLYFKSADSKGFPYTEQRVITAIFASKKNDWDYYRVKGILEVYLESLGVQNCIFTKKQSFPYQLSASVQQGDKEIATIGLINPVITKSAFQIAQDVYGFVIDIDALSQSTFTGVDYMPYSIYPEIRLDMSVQIPTSVQAGDVLAHIKDTGGELLRSVTIENVYEKDPQNRSILLSLVYQSKERNLTTEEVNKLHTSIAHTIQTEFQATITGLTDTH